MKIIIIISIFLAGSLNLAFSQTIELDSLNNAKSKLILKKNEIDSLIKNIDAKINFTLANIEVSNPTEYVETKVLFEAKIKNQPELFGDIIGYLPKGTTVKVFDYYDSYWLIEKDSLRGYTSEMYLSNNSKMNTLKRNSGKEAIIKKYGNAIGAKIISHQIWIGMTKDMARLSIGSPLKINRTVSDYGVREQWVYKNRYLYFEDDKLTSWQD